jgi:hypothetical protein
MSSSTSTCTKEFRDVGSSTGEVRAAILSCWLCVVQRVVCCHRCRQTKSYSQSSQIQPGPDLGQICRPQMGHRLQAHAGVDHYVSVKCRGLSLPGLLVRVEKRALRGSTCTKPKPHRHGSDPLRGCRNCVQSGSRYNAALARAVAATEDSSISSDATCGLPFAALFASKSCYYLGGWTLLGYA